MVTFWGWFMEFTEFIEFIEFIQHKFWVTKFLPYKLNEFHKLNKLYTYRGTREEVPLFGNHINLSLPLTSPSKS